jgi:hypothetical protein
MLRSNRRKGQKGKRSKSHNSGTVAERKIERRKGENATLRADICICQIGNRKTIYNYEDENGVCRCLHCRKKLSEC